VVQKTSRSRVRRTRSAHRVRIARRVRKSAGIRVHLSTRTISSVLDRRDPNRGGRARASPPPAPTERSSTTHTTRVPPVASSSSSSGGRVLLYVFRDSVGNVAINLIYYLDYYSKV
jgi:hypothetical protein